MNFITFCAIFFIPASLAFKVSFHEMDPSIFKYEFVPSLVCTPHQFMYQRGDNLNIIIQLLQNNYETNVTGAAAIVKTDSGIIRYEYEQWNTLKLQPLKTKQITVDLELTIYERCLRETILKGREIPANASDTGNRYNDICIKNNRCIAVVDEAKECRNMKPQPCGVTRNRAPLFLTAAPVDKHDKSLNETYKMLEILNTNVLAAINILNSLESPTRNISNTSSSTDAETSYFTVMIITSVAAAVALILLLVIAFRRFCRKTYNSPELPQKPATENRYYENMLFRDECQKQIDQLEQRAREVPQSSELQYEEINNRSNRW